MMESFVKKGFGEGPIAVYDNAYALPRGEFDLKKMVDEGIEKFVGQRLVSMKILK